MAEKCTCDDLIHDFELVQLIGIVGAKKTNDIVEYAIRTRENSSIRLVPTHDMLVHWSKPLINFLENNVDFQVPQTTVHFNDNVEFGNENHEHPTQVLGTTYSIPFR